MKKNKTKEIKKNLIIYQAKNGAIEFRGDFKNDTIWATQKQIAEVFGVTTQNITIHIGKIFFDKELDENSTCKESLQVQIEGTRHIERKVKEYNLDVIIAVGYRINSVVGTQFRIWATKNLKQHITKGYTINPKIIGKNYNEFMKAVESVQKLLPKNSIIPPEDILELVKAFAGTWFSLESYDEDKFPEKGFTKKTLKIEADELYVAVSKFKKELFRKKQATEFFAQERKGKELEGILGNVFQSIFGEEIYPSLEEKAVHLLYFIVKNHPFNDGNKRTGAFAFIWFLRKAGIQFQNKITPEALTAITLLVAISKPKEKDQIVGLILLLLRK